MTDDAPEETDAFRKYVRRAILLLAPELAAREDEICALIAEWVGTGAARQRWPDWASHIPRERREAIGLRVHAWQAWRRDADTWPELIDHALIAPVAEVVTGDDCCAEVRGIIGRLYAVDGLPIVPLPECREVGCRCYLRRLAHSDFDPTGAKRAIIAKRVHTENGVVGKVELIPRRR